ncbi:MAG: inorganic diphosphatase [Candidatus Eremiobacteraeota bacterium]|nr:inorganic diphosphatase [Candidatus Eremiobacteraeota bacterium]
MKTKPSLKYQTISPDLENGGEFDLRVVVETPRGSRHKFALDPELGAFVLKETLAAGLTWPFDYGFVPSTLGPDGDPLDIIILMDEPTFSGCVLNVRLIGAILMEQDGVANPRFLSCLLPREEVSLSTDDYKKISDLPEKLLHELEAFLKQYSEEKGHKIKMQGTCGRSEAMAHVREGRKAYDKDQA